MYRWISLKKSRFSGDRFVEFWEFYNLERIMMKEITESIDIYEDFPTKGIVYQDISRLYTSESMLKQVSEYLGKEYDGAIDIWFGIESRGYILASYCASRFGGGIECIRKKGKIPGKVWSQEYELEYGKDTLEISQRDYRNKVGIICDDVLATGGTLRAAKSLVERTNIRVVRSLVVLDLEYLRREGKDQAKSVIQFDGPYQWRCAR